MPGAILAVGGIVAEPRVFISHASQDRAAVEALAAALRERGIDVWLDSWEIGPNADIVREINEGLAKATAGVVVFSQHALDSKWVQAEQRYLMYASIQEGKPLVPVTLGNDAWVLPLLRRRIDETNDL